jgi:hypothetical protein
MGLPKILKYSLWQIKLISHKPIRCNFFSLVWIRNNWNWLFVENPLFLPLVCFSSNLLLSYLGHAHSTRVSLLADSFDLSSLLITFLNVALFSQALIDERIYSISVRNRFLLINPSQGFDSCWRTEAEPSISNDQSSFHYFLVIKLDVWGFYLNSRWLRFEWPILCVPKAFGLAWDPEWRVNWNTSFVGSRAWLHYFWYLHVTINWVNFSWRL